jgi:hypothetical protein
MMEKIVHEFSNYAKHNFHTTVRDCPRPKRKHQEEELNRKNGEKS